MSDDVTKAFEHAARALSVSNPRLSMLAKLGAHLSDKDRRDQIIQELRRRGEALTEDAINRAMQQFNDRR